MRGWSLPAPGETLWIADAPRDKRARDEIGALRDLLGDEAEPLLRGPWTLVSRCTGKGKDGPRGEYARIVAGDHVLVVPCGSLQEEDPAVVRARHEEVRRAYEARQRLTLVPPPATEENTKPEPEPARCVKLPKAPWADNVKLGAVYLEREPDGGHRVSLLLAPEDGARWKQAATLSGLTLDEVSGAVKLLSKRLAARAAGATDTAKKETGDGAR